MSRNQSQVMDYGRIDFSGVGWEAAGHGASIRLLRKVLSRLKVGRIVVETPSGDRVSYTATELGPEATVILHSWSTVRRLLAGGGVGFAESYMDGDWSSPDLTAILDLAARNLGSLQPAIAGSHFLRALNRLRHLRCANTRRGSRRNIASHYDLGNEFYREWLDSGMSYSSAWYETPEQALELAQDAKQKLAIDRLALGGGESVLEIGCGWGGLAEKMIDRGAAHVTGLSLSAAQLEYARARLDRAGMAGKTDMRFQDYRDVQGQFDRIVSIEMLEAVGQEYWSTYFETIRDRLKPGGTAVIQVITIAESRFQSYSRGVDFIQRYIFTGGMLPSDTVVRNEIVRAGLNLKSVETFGQSYALTLAEWKRRFHDAWSSIQTYGFDMRFKRMWEYYLSYCEAGFRTGTLDVGMYTLTR